MASQLYRQAAWNRVMTHHGGFATPILLIAWRRADLVRQVIEAIRPSRPTRVFVACDGPRLDKADEVEKVAETRALVDREIDWPCQISRLYAASNQGCRLGVSRAITWFFDNVEEGIILEDDCVPHTDFLPFCEAMLERYRDDLRVWCVSGNNFQKGHWRGDGSYFFGQIPLIWGWATWRSRWRLYDGDLSQWPAIRASGLMHTLFEDPVERRYWGGIWDRLFHEGQPDSWAYRWCFTCNANGGLTVIPNRNLVHNIGFGPDATHTTGDPEDTAIDAPLGPLIHPRFVLRDTEADRFTFDHKFCGAYQRSRWKLLRRMASRILRAFRRTASAVRGLAAVMRLQS